MPKAGCSIQAEKLPTEVVYYLVAPTLVIV